MSSLRFMALVSFFVAQVSCTAATNTAGTVDEWTFAALGGTVFSSPPMVSLKEVHLARGQLSSKQIVVEGQVIKFNQFGTYLILKDQDAKLLVVLTDVIGARQYLDSQSKAMSVKVLGTIRRGSEGYPYVKATSMRIAQN